jgi:Mg2+-importing ATPase
VPLVANGADASARGLRETDAEQCLARFGRNELSSASGPSIARQLVQHVTSPLVAVLLVASIASAALRDFANAGIVVTIVALSIAIELVQTRRSSRAAEALKSRVAHTATVLRDGAWGERPRAEIVPGDVVRLSAGDLVPADARLLESRDLHVNEAALTGESLPAEKDAACGKNVVLMGSSVVSGYATALVTATGPRTQLGAIAKGLSLKAPPSEFERGLSQFGSLILKTVVFLVLFVVTVLAVLHRDPFQSVLFAVALAVGLTPEFLPMITTITLTKGAMRMADAHVIVKNLAAIQNFGSIDILCCDKTGTLTTADMRLEHHVDPFGETSDRPLLLAYVNSYFESGVDNPLDEAVLRKAHLDPLDSAVLRHAHPDIAGFAKLDELPFDFERRRVTVLARRGNEALFVTKGAPESLLSICATYEIGGITHPLDAEARAHCERTYRDLSMAGYRVLGVAYAPSPAPLTVSRENERDLVLAGFVAFLDPPRDDARGLIAKLAAQGVQVKVLTGDNEIVTAHICRAVGVSTEGMLVGGDIEAMTDPALAYAVERAQVMARLTPAQKSRVLHALRARGHVVGFLGDGINDAPSLHAADVGISVANAVDVAKEAGQIILLQPGLEVLLGGIVEGRKAFGNVMKYLLMGTSSNFGNMLSMAGAAVFLPFLPMLPSQILLNNLLYDVAQITIPSDEVDATFVQKPHRWDIGLIRRFMVAVGPISSIYDFLTFYVLLKVLHAPEALFHTGWFVESLATQTLVIFVIRTAANPFRSRPSRALVASTLGIVLLGLVLPYLPFARVFGFVPLPARFYVFLALATATYLGLVEMVKRALFRRSFG